ncbi:DUF456 domain-containing protein [Riemerella columbina]|uniref:DUF456 domain-containing protein n=1 Tax=Riemerella columbina TaxID=103810 RepID=UPI000373209B|nr:DUF456 domain-containing protein [Riemerella columbina]
MDTQTILVGASIILILVGILGTFLPVLPGLILCFGGLSLYKFGAGAPLPMVYLYIFGIVTVLSMLLDYIVPARLNRKYGGTKWGSIGAVMGAILGLFFIPIPLGFLIGMFLGVWVAELLHDRNNHRKALNSAKGALIGFLYSTALNLSIGIAMLIVVLWNYFT